MILYDLKMDIYVVYRSDEAGRPSDTLKKLATIVVKGEPMPGKDIAILKISDGDQLPVLKLAPTDLPEVGEQLFVYGYPGPVTNNDFVSAASAIEPTLTTGIVSAIKQSVGNWPVIQMDANINHGSSGGPVCNENGEVVGLTTFGSLENTGGLAAGLNFAVPVSILNEYLDSADVNPAPSQASRRFAHALDTYDQHRYNVALKEFRAVQHLNSQYPGIYTYIGDCQALIKARKAHTIGPVERIVIIAGFILVLLGVLAIFKTRHFA
jgi:hypothetical protein